MPNYSIFSILLALLIAVVVYIVGTTITSFHQEGLVWGLIAALVFLAIAFGDRHNRRVL
jgi:hypothetical protein